MPSPTDPRARAFDNLIQSRIDDGLRQLDPAEPALDPPPAAAIDIIVPVFDAHDAVIACLASLLAWTEPRHRLILIDDASTDSRIWPALQGAAASRPGTELRRHQRNQGYLRTVNAAITTSTRDVVLLNSDTEVGPQWLDRLAAAAHDDRAGLACPLSDNATLLSVIAPIDIDGLDAVELQRRVVASARLLRPRLPVAVGFCLYVRREVSAQIGRFDEAFDPGYGEESDFSMRALAAGFEIVVANDVLVRHRSGSSFGDAPEIRRRRLLHAQIVRERWPQHDALIQAWWRDWPLREQAERLRAACASGRPRVLQIAHGLQRLGGIELHSRALVASLAREVDVDLVATEPSPEWADACELERGAGWSVRAVNRRQQRPNQTLFGVAADLSDPAIERQFLRSLVGGGYRILHVHSLLRWNSLMLPLLAKAAGVRVLVSLHDLSPLCPNYLMLPKDAARSCGKAHAGVDAGCIACLDPYRSPSASGAAADPETYLAARWHVWKRVLEAADAIVAPSKYLVDKLARSFGAVVADRARIIPHGLAEPPAPRLRPTGQPLRIGFLFGESRGKGSERVLAIAQALADSTLRFVVHAIHDRSALPAHLPANLELHGSYPPERLAEVLADLDLVLMPTLVGESYSLALSECRAAGVPVLASRDGAFVERIDDGVDGWLLSVDRIDDWVALLRHLDNVAGRVELRRVAQRCMDMPTVGIDANADRYLALYEELLALPSQRLATNPSPQRDLASTRLAVALRDPASFGARRCRDDAMLPPTDPAQRPRLQIALLVQEHNRALRTATLDSLRHLGPDCVVVELGDSSSVPIPGAAAQAGDRPLWHVLIEAGDRLHPSTLDWLSRYAGSDTQAVCADFDRVDSSGRHYAATAQPTWDGWRALADPGHAPALFVRDAVWRDFAGWSRNGPVARAALQFSIAVAGMPVTVLGRVLLHAADINRSPALRESVWRAQLDCLLDCLDRRRWSVLVSPGRLGWVCAPRLLVTSRVLVLVWSERGVGADVITALRQQLALHDVTVMAHQPQQPLPDCDVVAFWRADVAAPSVGDFERLLAWLQQGSIAAVAPRRVGQDQRSRSTGFAVDGEVPGWLPTDADGCVDLSSRRAALSTVCLLVRRDRLQDDDVATLAAMDSAASVAIQLRWQEQGRFELLLVGDVVVEQRLGDSSRFAAAKPADTVELDLAWQGLGPLRRTQLCRRPAARAGLSLAGLPKQLPRIAVLTRDDWASSQYRVHLPLRDLHRQGLIDAPLVWRLREEAGPGLHQLEIEQPDLLIAHHAFDDASLRLIEQASRQLRLPIVAVVDDLVDAVPDSNPMRAQMPQDIERRLRSVLRLSDCLVVTSRGLADAYAKHAWRCVTIENALPLSQWSGLAVRNGQPQRRLRVGWAGAQQHQADLALIDPLLLARPDLQWVFMGMAPASAAAVAAELHPMTSYEDYPRRLAELQLDIALVPLLDDAFNRCKSALKLIELGALGIAVIASDVAPYRDAPVCRVGPDPAAWTVALDQYANDALARRNAGAALQRWVHDNHDLSHRRTAWCEALSLSLSTTPTQVPLR